MANPDHVKVVENGKNAIADWRSQNGEDLDLSGANLKGIDLTDADLSNAKLDHAVITDVNLEGADLANASLIQVHFKDVQLMRAKIVQSTFSKEVVDPTFGFSATDAAKFENVDLTGADLTGSNMEGVSFRGSKLNETVLVEADLRSINAAETSFCDAILQKATLNWARLEGADLERANLSEARIYQTNLEGANLTEANLSNAKILHSKFARTRLDNAKLIGATFSEAKPRKKKFRKAHLRTWLSSLLDRVTNIEIGLPSPEPETSLSGATLSGADLTEANLSCVCLANANLKNANLNEANLECANLTKANLTGSILSKSRMRGAWLIGASLESADFQESDLRDTVGAMFHSHSLRDVRLSHNANHPWLILRCSYTGPRLAFLLIFTLAALFPLICRAFFWAGISKLEQQILPLAITAIDKTVHAIQAIPPPYPPEVVDWLKDAQEFQQGIEPWVHRYQEQGANVSVEGAQIEKVTTLLLDAPKALESLKQHATEFRSDLESAENWVDQTQQMIRVVRPTGKVQQRRVWELVVGIDSGFWSSLLVLTLLVYNGIRAFLTYTVAPIRYEEEQTGITPAKEDYRRLWILHNVASSILFVSVASGAYHFWLLLSMPVLVPG